MITLWKSLSIVQHHVTNSGKGVCAWEEQTPSIASLASAALACQRDSVATASQGASSFKQAITSSRRLWAHANCYDALTTKSDATSAIMSITLDSIRYNRHLSFTNPQAAPTALSPLTAASCCWVSSGDYNRARVEGSWLPASMVGAAVDGRVARGRQWRKDRQVFAPRLVADLDTMDGSTSSYQDSSEGAAQAQGPWTVQQSKTLSAATFQRQQTFLSLISADSHSSRARIPPSRASVIASTSAFQNHRQHLVAPTSCDEALMQTAASPRAPPLPHPSLDRELARKKQRGPLHHSGGLRNRQPQDKDKEHLRKKALFESPFKSHTRDSYQGTWKRMNLTALAPSFRRRGCASRVPSDRKKGNSATFLRRR